MSDHTLEPWVLKDFPCIPRRLVIGNVRPDSDLKLIARLLPDILEEEGPVCAETRANGRRIVACVNTCMGVPVELLEMDSLARVVAAMSEILWWKEADAAVDEIELIRRNTQAMMDRLQPKEPSP